MIDQVVLINSTLDLNLKGKVGPGDQHLGLLTIREGLREAGFNNVVLFPQEPIKSKASYLRMINGLEEVVTNEENTIVGITAMTEVYSKFVLFSKIIKNLFPNAGIIGGGPHFRSEPWNKYRDPIEMALENGLAHAIVQGHAQPFIDLVTKYAGNLEAAKNTSGLYMLNSSGNVVGSGLGKYPKVDQLPYVSQKVKISPGEYGNVVHILFDGSCNNFCDFCAVDKSRNKVTKELAKATLEKVFEGIEPAYLRLTDSNPFEPEKIDFYEEIFNHLGSKNDRIVKTGFVDPSLFTDESYFPRLLEFFFKYNFRKFFIGRDCVTEENARIIGSRYRGKLRSQEQLDREKKGIERFISELYNNNVKRKSNGLRPCNYEVRIPYIATPYGKTKEPYLQMLDEMEQFQNKSKHHLKVIPLSLILAPLPGTQLKKRLLDDIAHPESFEEHSMTTNAWKTDLGPGGMLYAALDQLNSPRFKGPKCYSLLRKDVELVYSLWSK